MKATDKKAPRVLISGGGTGGHIFPALSIAAAIQRRHPEAEILFVGAEDRMEMERVPAAGYRIGSIDTALSFCRGWQTESPHRPHAQ